MNERRMLEMAAKAAGIQSDLWAAVDRHRADLLIVNEKGGHTVWNPLTDDGDALRLAVRLNIPVIPYDDETSTGTVGVVAKNWGSKEENTRRAIVRAAAAIGEAMP